MPWTVAQIWSAASRFDCNCYRHFLRLLIRVLGDRTPHIILRKEGFTQGDPMAIPLYSMIVAVLSD